MVLGGDGEPIKRGFFCNDETIKYPAPKDETVPMSLCMIIWFALTISTIVFVEVISFGTIKSQKLSLPLPFKVNISYAKQVQENIFAFYIENFYCHI